MALKSQTTGLTINYQCNKAFVIDLFGPKYFICCPKAVTFGVLFISNRIKYPFKWFKFNSVSLSDI